jgi:hypothetical protein
MQVYWANKAYWPIAAFDGGRFRCLLADGWKGDPVGGFDEAAAVDEIDVDRACWVELTGRVRSVRGSPS